ncbi:MAG: DNA recombination protein RmuC [Candidatus Omnitrophica bacterium]|nr:DNA recombination protein RmuC [Candidatus Omnitrophota bacterium]
MIWPIVFAVVVLGLLLALLFKTWNLVSGPLPAEKLEKLNQLDALTQTLAQLSAAVNNLQAQWGRDSALQSDLGKLLKQVGETSRDLATLKGERQKDLEASQKKLHEISDRLGSVQSTLTGRKSGQAGENILREVLRVFPPEWIQSPYRDVEFGLVLFDRRVVPVDSKFTGIELLDQLGQSQNENEKAALAKEIERRILERAREVSKYLDPSSTTSVAVCAVPDSAYGLLRKAHYSSYKEYRVVLMPYSMTVPYLLSLYDLHLSNVGQIDEVRLEAFVASVEQAVKTLNEVMENKVKDAGTRVSNAYRECVQAIGVIEGALANLKSSRVQTLTQMEVEG